MPKQSNHLAKPNSLTKRAQTWNGSPFATGHHGSSPESRLEFKAAMADLSRSSPTRSSKGAHGSNELPGLLASGTIDTGNSTLSSIASWLPTLSSRNQIVENIPDGASSSSPNEAAATSQTHSASQRAPVALEGTMKFRKCRTSTNLKSWRKAYVVFDMRDGGSLSCYKEPTKKSARGLSSELTESLEHDGTRQLEPRICLPSHLNWVAKDIQNNSSAFVIEISTDEPFLTNHLPNDRPQEDNPTGRDSFIAHGTQGYDSDRTSSDLYHLPDELEVDILRAKERGQNFRLYFRCSRRGNEKVLWLRAFEQVGRLSLDLHVLSRIRSTLGNPHLQISHSRFRNATAQQFAMETRTLDDFIDESDDSIHDDPGMQLRERFRGKGSDAKEYLVYPLYAYPNRWMTDAELYTEMAKPTETFHDLRIENASTKEIGLLKVEILQCIGLPALDFASETDAVAYMVCGSYAFTSDVIWNRLNPMWLPRSRRACVFPVYHAFARLYVGIFDDDGKGEKDDFAGRVVLNLAQCRPRTTYDVTLPLRMSANVYSRRQRGSVRLRFSVDYYSDREALLSYIPNKIPTPSSTRPDDDVTVICKDEKAFRNIVTTVHGVHMPGRFSFSQWRAVMKELNFARKVALNCVFETILDIIKWQNPALSCLLFGGWMRCVYKNSFAIVPFYVTSFLLLMMIRNYVFYGSDGPIQNGFIPPSWEEMVSVLLDRSGSKQIEPLQVKPSPRSNATQELVASNNGSPRTHRQSGKWLFRLLGFRNSVGGEDEVDPKEYHMEFPYSRGLRHPETKEIHYPKYTVKESLVSKTHLISGKRKKIVEEDDRSIGGMLPARLAEDSTRGVSFAGIGLRGLGKKEKTVVGAVSIGRQKGRAQQQGSAGTKGPEERSAYDKLPPRLRFPEQDIDGKNLSNRKKKIGGELSEIKNNAHKLTLHVFHDRTHLIRRKDSTYFGHRFGHLETDLERLLNIGQFSAANPVVSRVGLYLEPMIGALQSLLSLTRVSYNVLTWRDPILSFWLTLFLAVLCLILCIFPWRVFFLVTGLLILGPQNYVLRVMEERGVTPRFIKKIYEKRKNNQLARQRRKLMVKESAIPHDQPVVGAHTSDNMPPPTLSLDTVDPRGVHEVSVPYSRLNANRFYDWPPEPQYASCEPTQKLERITAQRLALRHTRSNLETRRG